MTKSKKRKQNKTIIHNVFQKRVHELMAERKYSTYQLAYRASLPLTTLAHMLKGESTNASLYSIVKICDGLDMTLAEFFDSEDFEKVIIESRDEK